MKKIAVALLVTLSFPAFGEWQLMETTKSADHLYYYAATLERDGTLVRVWMMTDLHEVNLVGRLSYRNRHEFDCHASRHRITHTESYSTHMAVGKPIDSDDDPQDWKQYGPGALYESERNVLCGK